MFTFVQLTHFVAVAEELHFGRAAERLRMTQPPLSRQIQLLEKEVGAELFDRSNRTVRLTRAGQAFLVDARRLLQQAERATLAVRRVSAGTGGVLRVGFTGASVHSGLPLVLATARTLLPDVDVELRELVTMDQVEALSDGSLDLGMVRPPITRPDLSARTFVREGLIAALPGDHPLAASADSLPIATLHGADMVMYAPVEARYFHELVTSVLHAAAVVPAVTQYMTQVHSILALVNLGWGAALVPESAAGMRFDKVRYRPLAEIAQVVELDLVWRQDNENPALARLLRGLGVAEQRPSDTFPVSIHP
ncbi:LysR substrate-binding domain-containing protein [Nocardia barduliensis]|uniref:LysR substrate-binding domain-containing protein n=1 Tax=Nocardia barduliensis TaxID=2736643 RepID=UPI001572EE28|nr:LysR substrate-binding domain-containing protein [Nocardia barduliensis]